MREVKREEYLQIANKLRGKYRGSRTARTQPVLMKCWKVFETLQSKSGLVLAQVEYTFPSQGVAEVAHEEMRHVQMASSVKYMVKDAAGDQS